MNRAILGVLYRGRITPIRMRTFSVASLLGPVFDAAPV